MVKLRREDVERVFKEAKDQADYIIGLFRLVFPDFDEIASVGGYPTANANTRTALCRLCVEWDEKHLPGKVMRGGAWINYGFSGDDRLNDWDVGTDRCNLVYKEKARETAPTV